MGDRSLNNKAAEVGRDERASGWARGDKLEDLRRITSLFNRHDEGLLRGPFDRYRDRDAANDLRDGWLKLGPRDAESVPIWACVLRELVRNQPVRDFTDRGADDEIGSSTACQSMRASARKPASMSVA
jgi:hypothetical protein